MSNPMLTNTTNALISLLLMYSANLLHMLNSNGTLPENQFAVINNQPQVQAEAYTTQNENFIYASNYGSSGQDLNYVKGNLKNSATQYSDSTNHDSNAENISEEEKYNSKLSSNSAIKEDSDIRSQWNLEEKYKTSNQKPTMDKNYQSRYLPYWIPQKKNLLEPNFEKKLMNEQIEEEEKSLFSNLNQENVTNYNFSKPANGYKSAETDFSNMIGLDMSSNISTFIQPVLHFPPIPLKTYSSPQEHFNIKQNLSDPTIYIYIEPESSVITTTVEPSEKDLFQEPGKVLPESNTNSYEVNQSQHYILQNKASLDYDQIQESSNFQENNEIHQDNLLKSKNLNVLNKKENVNHEFYKRFCYYLLNSQNNTNLKPDLIDPFLCTHIIVGFLIIDQSNQINFEHPEKDAENLREIINLTKLNKDLKILMSIKVVLNNEELLTILDDKETYNKLINSIFEIVVLYNLDGIDLWLELDPHEHEKNNLKLKEIPIEIIMDLKKAQKKNDFLITTSVSSSVNIFSQICDIGKLAKIIDFVNLLPFDCYFYNYYLPYTQHHNKLFPNADDKGYFANLNIAWVIEYWMGQNMPVEKIMVGVATYAKNFKLLFLNQTNIGSPASNVGFENNRINYSQVCRFLNMNATREFEPNSLVPFAYKGHDWIGYENEKSVSMKSRFVTIYKLGGITTYALNYDDWKGECRKDFQTFPLQKAINDILTNKFFVSF